MIHAFKRRAFLRIATGLGASYGLLPHAFAQGSQPIRLVIGFPPGGPSDLVARILAERLRAKLDRTVVVENRPGAASRLARAEVKRAAPNGNTLIFSPVGATSVLPHLFTAKNLGYVASDFVPVARAASFEYVLTIGNHVKASNLQELKKWLIENPTQANCASPGAGTIPHLLGLVLADAFKAPITMVHYKGISPALQDLMGGHVAMSIDTPSDVLEFYRGGKIKVLASISDTRALLMPDVPTLKEQGVPISADSFSGIWAPAGTPADVVARINAAVVAVLAEPAVKEQIERLGMRAAPSTPLELSIAERDDTKRWESFIKTTGIEITD